MLSLLKIIKTRNLLNVRFSEGLQDGDSLHDKGQCGGENPPGDQGHVQLRELGLPGFLFHVHLYIKMIICIDMIFRLGL